MARNTTSTVGSMGGLGVPGAGSAFLTQPQQPQVPQMDIGSILAALSGIAIPPPGAGTPTGSPVGTGYAAPIGPQPVPQPAAPAGQGGGLPTQPMGQPGIPAVRGGDGAVTPSTINAPAGQAPGMAGFGFGDFLNLLTNPIQSGGWSGLGQMLGQGLAGLGQHLTNPVNQFAYGSMLANGAPVGTNPQRMGQMFATQGAQELQGPMAAQAYYGQGIPQQQGQQGPQLPQMQQSGLTHLGQQGQQQGGGYGNFLGGTPNFSNNVPAIDPAVARTMSLGDWATLSGIRTQTAETARLGRETSLKEQAAPYENIDRLYRAYANSPQSTEHKYKLETELAKIRGGIDPYTYDTREIGDQVITYRRDKRGGPVQIVRMDRNTPSAKEMGDLLVLQDKIANLPFNRGLTASRAIGQAMSADYTTAPSEKLKAMADTFLATATGEGMPFEEAVQMNPFIPQAEKQAALQAAGGTSLAHTLLSNEEE